jgi:hypothetical protein
VSGLTEKDLKVLSAYADSGNRELYWNYLAQLPGSDGYGLLALGVVRNDNLPGRVANSYAQDYAQNQSQHGTGLADRRLSEREWDAFGQTLLTEDLERRNYWMRQNDPARALNLPGRDVQQAHDVAFRQHELDPNCWTPRLLLDAVRRKDGEAAAEKVWTSMLNNEGRGAVRIWDTTGAALDAMPKADAANYLGKLTLLEIAATQDRGNVDPNVVGALSHYHVYDQAASTWYRMDASSRYLGPREERDTAKLAELNDVRALRLERQEKAGQFHAEDGNTSIKASPQTAMLDRSPADGVLPRRLADLQPGDRDYALYTQIREGVAAMDAAQGRGFDATSERMTASLMVHAREAGIERVDHVVLSRATDSAGAGQSVFLVQGDLGDPAHLRSSMATNDAVRAPVEESMAGLASATAIADQSLTLQTEQQKQETQNAAVRMS